MSVNELYQLIRTEECCLWIGAGFSRYAGYPLASDLQKKLYEDLTAEEAGKITLNSSLFEFCEDYQALKGRSHLIIHRLQQIFRAAPLSTEHHNLLAKIAYFKSIVTTNYDHLIESSYSLADRVIIKCDADIPDMSSNNVKIYKVHGDLLDGDSIVITSSDYSHHYNRNFKDPFWASV